MPTAEKYDLVSLLSVVGKSFVKLIHTKLVDYLEKGRFCMICSTIFQAFYLNGKSFDNLHKFKSYLNLCHVSGFILPFFRNGFEWLWMGSLCKNIQLILQLAKSSFFVIHFSCCTWVHNLMSISVTLLSMLMVLSTLSVIRHLICGSN